MVQYSPFPGATPFGLWLRQRRKALDLTQEKLAAAIDVSLPTIVKIEAGERRPSREVAELLARRLQVSAEELPDFMRLARAPLESHPATAPPPLSAAVHPAQFAAAAGREPAPEQGDHLPTPLTSFVGRQQEIATIRAIVQGACSPAGVCRVVTLTGPGGSGKTRLAIQVARLEAPQHSHGAWWADLSTLRDAALVPDSVLRALGMTPAPGQPTMQTLINYLRERDLLLLLDNCEHLLEACAQLVAAILQTCPAIFVLVTSREPLGVPGEQLWPVPTFSVPAASNGFEIDALLSYDGVRLFVERARMHRPAFELRSDNAAQVAEICRRLNGIPLAIELAAARVRMMEVDEILIRLQNCLRLLASTSTLAPPRQQTLRASIDWSHNLLSPAECLLLQRLAVFVGGCTLAAAEAVCTDRLLAEEEILDLLGRLVDRSLVVVEGGRYGFLETIREYALERLTEAGESEMLRERHGAYFAGYMGEHFDVILSGEQHQAIVEIAAELGNVRAAWDWAVTARRYDLLWRATNGLTWYYELHSRFYEGEVVYGRAIDALSDEPDADHDLLARLRTHHGYFLDRLGRLDEARLELAWGSAELRQANQPRELSIALTFQGTNAWQQGDYARAYDLLQEGLGIARTVNDKTYAALSLFFLGLVEHAMGDEAAADRSFREGLATGYMLRQPRMISMIAVHWALTLLALGRYGEARERLLEGLAVARETQDRWLVGTALGHLGMVMLAQGDHAGARAALLEAVALARETGGSWDRSWGEVSLGSVYLAEGDAEQAEAHYRLGLRLALDADAVPLILDALTGFAELRALTRDREGALELARHVCSHGASSGNARARAGEVLRMLDAGGGDQPLAPPAGAFEETVSKILGVSEGAR